MKAKLAEKLLCTQNNENCDDEDCGHYFMMTDMMMSVIIL